MLNFFQYYHHFLITDNNINFLKVLIFLTITMIICAFGLKIIFVIYLHYQ
jgi:hypothetical protein